MTKKINPVRDTDNEAIALARQLCEEAKYACIAVSECETGVPLVSRLGAAWSPELGLFFHASDLSVHSKCLVENPVCSLLLGEPGKGDGLAHPRITMIGKAKRMQNDDARRPAYREAFLKIHPKAALYVDFLDFGFYPLEVERAQLNGGFGKAYHLAVDEMVFLPD